MKLRNCIRLAASFAALALSAAIIFAANQTLCRYMTADESEITLVPGAKRTLTAMVEEKTVTLEGEGRAHVYLQIPADMQIKSVTVNGNAVEFLRGGPAEGTAAYDIYSEGFVVWLMEAGEPMVFRSGDVIQITVPETGPAEEATSEAEPASDAETTPDTEPTEPSEPTEPTSAPEPTVSTDPTSATEPKTDANKIRVIIVPINEKGGSPG